MGGTGRPDREIPYCTIFLVVATLVCHSMVLSGNLGTAQALGSLGDSTDGWSDVGLFLSKSLSNELDTIMSSVSGALGLAIADIGKVQSALDSAISVTGQVSDAATQFYARVHNGTQIQPAATSGSSPVLMQMGPKTDAAVEVQIDAVIRAAPVLTVVRKLGANASGKAPGDKALMEVEVSADGEVATEELSQSSLEEEPEKEATVLGQAKVAQTAPSKHQYSARAKSHLAVLAGAQVKIGSMLAVTRLPGALPFGQPLVVEDVLQLSGNSLQRISKWDLERMEPAEFRAALEDEMKAVAAYLMDNATGLVDSFFVGIKPSLEQVGAWLVSFGDKLQAVIQQFSTTLDRVQKIFDQLMSKLNPNSPSDERMRELTFTLFDTENSGTCSYWDLTNTSLRYGVPALKGEKSMQLILKYSTNGDLEIDTEEFSHMVHDESLPGVMETVLRAYAKSLSHVAGNVAAGVMTDEVAKAVADWIALVQDQNETQVEWVAMRMTNASLPTAFSAVLLRRLYMALVSPENVQLVDFGQDFVRMMVRFNLTHTLQALDILSEPAWWENEGFDTYDLPQALSRVTGWVTTALDEVHNQSKASKTALLQEHSALFRHAVRTRPGEAASSLAQLARQYGKERVLSHRRNESAASGAAQAALYSTSGAQALRERLLGGASASSQGSDPEMRRAAKRGQKASAPVLEFAQFLAWNSTADADEYQRESFKYSSTSSSALDTFANQIQAMIKKVQNFLNTMKEYCQPVGIKRLEAQVKDFSRLAAGDVVDALMQHVDRQLEAAFPGSPTTQAAAGISEDKLGEVSKHGVILVSVPNSTAFPADGLTGVWTTLLTAMSTLQQTLPGVVDDMIFARKEVSAVAATMKSTFGIFKVSGPPIFLLVAKLYKTIWTAYFAVFGLLTLATLFYGLWASGFFGGPQAATVQGYEAPRGFWARCRVCCASCNACLRSCHDSHLFFWSVVLIMEVFVLALFLSSILLCLLAGIKSFMAAGCSQIYILGDNSICTGVLETIREWLLTFWEDAGVALGNACTEKELITCDLIGARLKGSVLNTVLGSLLASVLSFQLILESAVLHERARWRRIFDEEAKVEEDKSLEGKKG